MEDELPTCSDELTTVGTTLVHFALTCNSGCSFRTQGECLARSRPRARRSGETPRTARPMKRTTAEHRPAIASPTVSELGSVRSTTSAEQRRTHKLLGRGCSRWKATQFRSPPAGLLAPILRSTSTLCRGTGLSRAKVVPPWTVRCSARTPLPELTGSRGRGARAAILGGNSSKVARTFYL